MSGFLERVVARALGVGPVVHRRREPLFAAAPESYPGAPPRSAEASVEFESGAEVTLARRTSPPPTPERSAADATDTGRRNVTVGERGVPEAARLGGSDAGRHDASDVVRHGGPNRVDSPSREPEASSPLERPSGARIAGTFLPPLPREGEVWTERSRHTTVGLERWPESGAAERGMPGASPMPLEDEDVGATFDRRKRDSGIGVRVVEPAPQPSLARSAVSGDVGVLEAARRRESPAIDERVRALGAARGFASAKSAPPFPANASEDNLTINVTIGRIDVARSAPAPARPQPAAPPRPSLDDYLQLRRKQCGR